MECRKGLGFSSYRIPRYCGLFVVGLTSKAFDDRLWAAVVDSMMVYRGGDVVFTFRGGYQVTVMKDELTVWPNK